MEDEGHKKNDGRDTTLAKYSASAAAVKKNVMSARLAARSSLPLSRRALMHTRRAGGTVRPVAATPRKGQSAPPPPPAAQGPPGRPLTTPPALAVAAALGGLSWVSLLGFPASPLPAPLRELGLSVVTEATARTIAGAAWAAHAAEAAYAVFACLSAGADAGAAAWWAFWAFFAGFPALLVMSKTLTGKQA